VDKFLFCSENYAVSGRVDWVMLIQMRGVVWSGV